MGRGGARARAGRGPADPAVDRLLGLPLVPRDGARVLRGRGDRPAHERALRVHQARPRGAPRRGLHLHGGLPGDDRQRRLAPERLPHPGAGAVLRRHLLPARAADGRAQLAPGAGRGGRRLDRPRRGDPRRRGHGWPSACAGAPCCGPRRSRCRRARSTRRWTACARATTACTAASAARPSSRPRPPSSSCSGAARSDLALHTLRAMAAGGIHDQVGGGFHRYTVDDRWLVPHFEKMLYDNALLARAYVHGWQVSGDPLLRRRGRGHARLDAEGDARPGGRLLLGARRGLRGRGGPLLRLEPRRAPGAAGRRGG